MNLGIYLSKKKDNSFVTNAFIISVPFNSRAAFVEFSKFQYRIIDRAVAAVLVNYFEKLYFLSPFSDHYKLIKSFLFLSRQKHIFENNKRFDLQKILSCKTFAEFDEHFISKQLDYSSLDEYYEACSIDTKVESIQVPTLFLNSADDMFCPKKGN